MKKLLISFLSVVMVIGLVGGGYSAYFQDTETSTGNTFTAGILDLAVDCSSGGSVMFDASDDPLPKIFKYLPVDKPIAPGDSGEVTLSLHLKEDSINADLWMQVTGLVNSTGETPESEIEPGDNHISDNFLTKVWLDDGDNELETGETVLVDGTLDTLAAKGKFAVAYNVAAEDTQYVGWWWKLPEATGNELQGDTCTFNIIFGADQTTGYALTTGVTGSGTINISPGGGNYAPETPVTLTANAAIGSHFTGWSGDLTGMTNPGTVIMHGPKNVRANFALDEYTLTVNITGPGTVGKSPDKPTYHYGDVVQLTANPSAGCLFDSWDGGLSGSVNPSNITIYGNTTITAKFVQPVTPPANMVSWWTGDGTANDFYGTNNGTLNGATFTTGKVGQAFNFDGNDYISVNDSATLDIGTGHTIDMWVKLDNLPPNGYILADKWVSYYEDKDLAIRSDGAVLYYLQPIMNDVSLASNTHLEPGKWWHIAATYDGSMARIYINGQLDASRSVSGDIWDDAGNMYFGYHPTRPGGWFVPFRGQMDEIEWFNRALTQAEVQSIYNAKSAGKIKVWSLPRQYSGTQGLTNWYYYGHQQYQPLTSGYLSQLAFDNVVDPWGNVGRYDWNSSTGSRYLEFVGRDISDWRNSGANDTSGWLLPGEYGYNNIAAGWQAPYSGTVYISGMLNTTIPQTGQISSRDNGVYLSIYKGTTTGTTLLAGPSLVFHGTSESNRIASATLTPTTTVNAGDFIYFYADRGNWQDADQMYYSFSVSYSPFADLAAPVTNYSIGGGKLTLTATDAGSGVARIEYCRYSSPTTDWLPYTVPISVSSGQKYMYRTLDNNGNIEAYKRVTIP